MATLDFLSRITAVLIIGLVIGLVSKRLKLPSTLLLIVTGIGINNLTINGQHFFQFNDEFLISTSILALVMIVFKDSSNFTLHDLDTYSESAIKIAILFLVLNLFFLSIATFFVFGINNILLSLLFAAVMSGTDPGGVLSIVKTKANKITEILKFESVFNTPLIVLIPFIILDLMEIESGIITNFLEQIYPFLQQIITGIGTGVVVGIIVFRFMRRFYSQRLSPLTLITSSLLTYILAENLGGNGVLAVSVIGVFFGNFAVKKKEELQEFSTMLSNTLEILVFMLIGFLIPLKVDLLFLLKSVYLFIVMLIIRYVAIHLVYLHDHVNFKERIFMALNCTKGIAVAVVAFILSNFVLNMTVLENGIKITKNVPLRNILGTDIIINLMALFILYSIVVSSVAAVFSKKFIRVKLEES